MSYDYCQSVIAATGCVDPPGVVVTPSINVTLPTDSTIVVNYRCNVDRGRVARWEIMGVQAPFGSDISDELARHGIVISDGSNKSEVLLSIDQHGREAVGTDTLVVTCFSITDHLLLMFGCNYYVRTFGES